MLARHQAHLVKGALDVLDHQAGLACTCTSSTPQRALERTRTRERVSKRLYAVVTMGPACSTRTRGTAGGQRALTNLRVAHHADLHHNLLLLLLPILLLILFTA